MKFPTGELAYIFRTGEMRRNILVLLRYAAFLVAVILRARALVLDAEDIRETRPRSLLMVATVAFVVGLLTLPIAVPAAQAFWTRHVAKTLITGADRPYANDRRAMH